MGSIPVMVRSNRCNLYGMGALELGKHHEETEEMGGYFIVNGIERIIRMLIVGRRNHPLALVRPSFQNRGTKYSEFGVQIRCVRRDQTSQTNTLHYLHDGAAMIRFAYRKQEFLIPVMLVLRALVEAPDRQIFDAVVQGNVSNTFMTSRIELLLRSFKSHALHTKEACLAYLGSKFHVVLGLPEDSTDIENGEELLRRLVLVHLDSNQDKFNLLAFMLQKLYSLVAGECTQDNPDSPQHQEILLGGHLYGAYLKEKLEDYLITLMSTVRTELRLRPHASNFSDPKFLQRVFQRVPSDMGQKLEYFLATGNIVTNTGMDLQQMTGYTIVAEKLNFYRYLSHFRCVHRGAFFAELKTTTVRKLLPEAWGFLCPVHTPDGAPCGLLNHLAHMCVITTRGANTSSVVPTLLQLGVSPVLPNVVVPEGQLCVQLDGKVIGFATPQRCKVIAQQLRHLKVQGKNGLPLELEIGYVPPSNGGQYPGLFLYGSAARMIRPVRYLASQGLKSKTSQENTPEDPIDYVGSFEQVYMNIACLPEDIKPTLTTHMEIAPTSMLSVVANLTPFSDFNQSPRNMYQCQMGKQTMGTPAQVIARRTDNKMYHIQTPQTPIVRPKLHDQYGIDEFPLGMNAVIAVISYTSYDMEDAMIINRSSDQRGFGYGTVYKSEIVSLDDYRSKSEPLACYFGYPLEMDGHDYIDYDGMPRVGAKIKTGDPLACIIDEVTGSHKFVKYKGLEDAYIDTVRVLGSDSGDSQCTKLHIKLRIPRPPVIGDKFSSRHGQKGVCSQKWPTVDMPFSESGIVPDVIINPHAFPSRMTIGMFVEQMAAKSGALHGLSQDSTPFQFNEDHPAADFFGEQLRAAGYNYFGNEPMYSGITGEGFHADIYLGIVYYQRLRHMVSDKYQVRTTGPVHNLTMQPVKGRKRAGGIRFGEMERDSLLGHGVSFLLQDRLMNCSDYSQTHVCKTCGSFLGTISLPSSDSYSKRNVVCKSCGDKAAIDVIAIPYVFRYLCTELMAMGIRLKLRVT
jgi:DNA-directed RNA polymerase I subunit RPA2